LFSPGSFTSGTLAILLYLRRLSLTTYLGLAALGLAGVGCTSKGDPPPTVKKGEGGVPVSVATAVQKDVPLDIQVIGNVEAYSGITIKAQITGQLTKVHFREGDYVKKGDHLFTIDPRPFEAQLSQAEANVARDEAQHGQAEANLRRDMAQEKYLHAQMARYEQLAAQGIISKDQLEQMQANSDAVAQAVNADRAAVRSAQAAANAGRSAVDNMKLQLAYTSIMSPLDGRTGNLVVKEGSLVTANVTDLITINQVEPIYVTFSVPEANLPAIKQYMAERKLPVMVAPQDGASVQEKGDLSFVDNSVDVTTGTIKLKGTFGNNDRKLWPGQFVRVVLRLATKPNALVIPNQAVQTGQDGSYVYVVKQDRTVESRPVVTGSRMEQDIVVEKGLNAGDTVVTEGHLRLVPGMRVQVREGGTRRAKDAKGT
jgi:multidrug efflux system membrane fusion protein